ncbi:MAG: Ig-like domain-containing protein [Victivallales bacterium]
MTDIVTVSATINGQTYSLSDGGSGTWTATPTAPTASSGSNNSGVGPGVGSAASGLGYYPAVITVTDDYGNSTVVDTDDSTWGAVLKLAVLETVAPVASLQYPTDGSLIKSSKPTFQFKITDSGSGPDPSKCFINIDGAGAVQVAGSVSDSVCTVEYTPSSNLSDGAHSVEIFGDDFDGNESTKITADFTIDTTPPVLNVSAPESETSKINATQITVAGTTNDAASSPVTIAITGGTQDYAPVVSGGSFSQVVQIADNATSTLIITATDSAGYTTSVTRTVIVNTIPPNISAISLVPNPADGGATLTISVTVE